MAYFLFVKNIRAELYFLMVVQWLFKRPKTLPTRPAR
jgi:hypothetical protein